MKYGHIETNLLYLDKFDWDVAEEQCGLLIGKYLPTGFVRVFDMIRVPNRHEDPVNHFRAYAGDIPEHLHASIVGVAHTHWGEHPAFPSPRDLSTLTGRQVGILAHDSGQVVFFTHSNPSIATTTWR